ncbi:hypothetical protein [Streptomyces sp. UH6]|uniref:hypothetical protein n=1 Tax=Streptomyces sp. UH6 TaxID=2748379 RepID=UPI0015D51855|nr:hypothetical protein [Streptomyces sp. UH6]NYV73194.1 hypothetical protein [Streptomyces sp. UH6]
MSTRPIGDALDALGIEATLDEGELLAGAVVLLKVIDGDGDVRMSLAYSDGLSWIERTGMIHVAETMEAGTTTGLTGDG